MIIAPRSCGPMTERGEVPATFSRTDPRRWKSMSGLPSGKKMRLKIPFFFSVVKTRFLRGPGFDIPVHD
jgi:hypothetical protein